jgi:hypothetical protein
MLLDDKALLIYADELEFRRLNKFDNIAINTGAERVGKSMSTFAKKRLFESPFYQDKEKLKEILETDNWDIKKFTNESKVNLDEICFEIGAFQEQLSKITNGVIDGKSKMIVLDEAGTGLFALEWWSKEQISLYKEFQVIGKRQAIVEMNLPHKDDLNNRMRDRRVKFWSHVVSINNSTQQKIERGYIEIRQSEPDRWKLDIYWNPWIVCRFPDLSDEQWEKYEVKKDKYIDVVTSMQEDEGNIKTNGIMGNKYYNETNILLMEMLHPSLGKHNGKDGYTEGEIGNLLGKKQNTISDRVKKIREAEEKRIQYLERKEKIKTINGVENE